MQSKIENLGDYNAARLMVQEHGGDLSAAIKEVQTKAAPKYIAIGVLLVLPIWAGLTTTTKKMSAYVKVKRRKEAQDEQEEKVANIQTEEDENSEESQC